MKRMLIDASHPEETRVVVLDGSKVEEFDFEAASKRPLKGNIYLAKVTRVEPSLQAAFVEYGGNRQGFLAFSEIHPDYYQIPIADREALLAEQEAEARRRQEDDIESFEIGGKPEGEEEEEPEETVEEIAEDEGAVIPLDAASIGPIVESEPEEAGPSPEIHHTDEEPDEVFVNHGGIERDEIEPHPEDEEVPLSKSQAAHEDAADYGQDPDVAEAEAAEENEGEIEPVSVPEAPANADMVAAENAEDNEGAIEPVSADGETADGGEKKLQMQRPPQR